VRHPMAGRHGSRTLGQCGCPARSPKSKQAHQGPRSAVFDLDGTLVAGVTGVLLSQDTFRRPEIGARDRPDSRRTQETAPRRAAYHAPFRVHRPEPDWEGV